MHRITLPPLRRGATHSWLGDAGDVTRRHTLLQIFEYNGSAIVAMAGEQCFAIGSDLRFGVQFQTLATDYKKVYKVRIMAYFFSTGHIYCT